MIKIDIVDSIIAYEQGELDTADTINLFAELIRTGQAYSLQGHYGRMARALIEGGYITEEGQRTDKEIEG
jgi:hypothetical protein